MPYKFSYIVASNCYIYATWGCSSVGRALEWHSRGQRFDPAYLHFLKFKGVFMLSMSKLRDNSKWVLWTLLFFFVASMTVGGLVGGANILGTIQSFFGKVDTTLYVGKIGNESIPISYFLNERQIQLNRFRQQGRNIDSRAEQNASDFAWNNIIERKIKDEKINELNMMVQPDEVYNFLLLSPPLAFQNNLKELGLFIADPDYILTPKEKKHKLMKKVEEIFGLDLSKKHYKLIK